MVGFPDELAGGDGVAASFVSADQQQRRGLCAIERQSRRLYRSTRPQALDVEHDQVRNVLAGQGQALRGSPVASTRTP